MEIIQMSINELRKGEIISDVVNGDLTQQKASQELKMSLRQVKRLYKRFREKGLEGMAHKSRGKCSHSLQPFSQDISVH